MQEYFAKYGIAFFTFVCTFVIYPCVGWVVRQFKEKNEFKGELSAIKARQDVTDGKLDSLDRKTDHMRDKLDIDLKAISEILYEVKVNTAVNTSKLDDK